jgi:hypothetical protein
MANVDVTLEQKQGSFIVKAKCGGVIPDQEAIFDKWDQAYAFLEKLWRDLEELITNALDLRSKIRAAQRELYGGKQ